MQVPRFKWLLEVWKPEFNQSTLTAGQCSGQSPAATAGVCEQQKRGGILFKMLLRHEECNEWSLPKFYPSLPKCSVLRAVSSPDNWGIGVFKPKQILNIIMAYTVWFSQELGVSHHLRCGCVTHFSIDVCAILTQALLQWKLGFTNWTVFISAMDRCLK